MKFTIIFVIFALALVEFSSANFECTPGVPYRENDCNNCMCTDTKVLGCTFKACFGPKQDELRQCKVGTTSQQGCNTCICVEDMGTICTNNEC